MALNGLFCADVPLRNYSLTNARIVTNVQSVLRLGLLRHRIAVRWNGNQRTMHAYTPFMRSSKHRAELSS